MQTPLRIILNSDVRMQAMRKWWKRRRKLVLTDRAREVNKLMVEDFTEVEKILSKGFTEQEMKQFFDYMHRMQKNMKEATAR